MPPSFIYLYSPRSSFPSFPQSYLLYTYLCSCSPRAFMFCTHSFYVRTILLTYYLLGKSIVYMYLCSAPPLHVPTLYPWPFGLIIFLICTSFVPNLLGLLLNPASPSLNILSISFSAWLLLLPAHWRSFIRQGFILLSAHEEMPLLSCKATSGVGLNCGLAICCLVCAPTGYSTSNSQDG